MAKSSSGKSSADWSKTRILVLQGSQEMIMRETLDALKAAKEAEHGQVETIVFDGQTISLAEVFDELRSFGLMGKHKIVIVDHAADFLKTGGGDDEDEEPAASFSSGQVNHREALERYAQAPVDNATLVLRSENWNKGKLDDMIKKVGQMINCDDMSEAETQAWVVRRATENHHSKISSQAAGFLIERLGADLMMLDSELAKLALSTKPGEEITKDLITQTVGQSSEEVAWAIKTEFLAGLSQAASARKGQPIAGNLMNKIHEIIELSGQPEVMVMYAVADVVRLLNLAARMKKLGYPDGQIASELKLWGPSQSMIMGLIKKLDDRKIATMFDRIMEMDRRSKSGFGDSKRNIECFCAEFVSAAS